MTSIGAALGGLTLLSMLIAGPAARAPVSKAERKIAAGLMKTETLDL